MGVIQGSKNGPLFYDIYSGDFDKICINEHVLYADDTVMVFTGDNLVDLTHHVNAKLGVVQDWCNYNKLSLNAEKSQCIILSNKSIPFSPDINIGGNIVSKTKSFKYLGMHIDENMKFHAHLAHVKTSLSRHCGIIYHLKNKINLRAAKQLYYCNVYATFSYAISVYGGIFLSTERGVPLIKIQTRIMKNLFAKFYPN